MSFLKEQNLVIDDKDNVVLTNTFDTTDLEKELAEERKLGQDGKTVRKVCSIPEFEFDNDPILKRYQMLCELKQGEEAKKLLRFYLMLNPQYLATDKKF